MPQATFNFTGRKKLHYLGANPHFTLLASKNIGGGTQFKVEFNKKNISTFDKSVKIYVQPYTKGGLSFEPIYCGTIGGVKETNHAIVEFDPSELLFRIRFVYKDLIVARADKVRPHLGDEDDELKNSIIGIREEAIDQLFFY